MKNPFKNSQKQEIDTARLLLEKTAKLHFETIANEQKAVVLKFEQINKRIDEMNSKLNKLMEYVENVRS